MVRVEDTQVESHPFQILPYLLSSSDLVDDDYSLNSVLWSMPSLFDNNKDD